MKTERTTLPQVLAVALLIAPAISVRADIAGPYTADANTVYLFHFNELAGSVVAVNSPGTLAAGTNAVSYIGSPYEGDGIPQPLNNAVFGATAYPGFGSAADLSAANTHGLGVDINLDGQFTLDDNAPISPDRILTHHFFGADNAFTLEALVNLPGHTGMNRQIICTDSSAGTRGFQFRINTSGNLEFNFIGTAPAGVQTPIPVSGDHAFEANQWYHVAVTHDGVNTRFYWTRMNPANLAANLIGSFSTETVNPDVQGFIVIGNEARVVGTVGSTEGLAGLIDEVRISNIARRAGEMMFYTPGVFVVEGPTPTNQVVALGQPASFSILVGGTDPALQWRHNGTPIPNATNSTYAIAAVALGHAGNYDVVVTNISSAATSSVATLTVHVPRNLVWAGVGADWDALSPNWTADGGATSTTYTEADNVRFDSLGAAQPYVYLGQTLHPNSVVVDASTDYFLSSFVAGGIAGHAPLTKSGTGTLIIETQNSYSGVTRISHGILQIGNGGITGTLGTGTVSNNASLVFNRFDIVAVPNVIAGSGSVAVVGGGAGLSGSNTYSGPTLVSAGTLFARNWATIKLDGGSTLNLTNSAGITGADASLTLAGDGGSQGTVAGAISLGTGSVIKIGAGTWTLSNTANNYTGKTFINGGILKVSAPTGLGPAPSSFTADFVTLDGGSLGAATSYALSDGLRGISVVSSGGLNADLDVTLSIGNDILGVGPLTKSGPGTVVLSGPKSFSGVLNVDTSSTSSSDGVLRISSSAAVANVLSPIAIRNNNGGSSTLQLDGSGGAIAVSQEITLNGRNNSVPAIVNVAGNNTLSGNLTINVGGGQYRIQSDSGELTLGGTISSVASGSRTFTFQGTGDTAVTGVIENGVAIVGLVKEDDGLLTLAGLNTYSGTTTVSNGTLAVNGQIGPGPVTVAGGSLGGSGTVAAPVTVHPAGALSPGTSIVTLTINNDLTLAGNLLIEVNKALSPAQSNDTVAVSGTLNNIGTGTVLVSNLGPALAVGDTFFLFNKPMAGAGALTVTGGGVVWNNNLAVNGSISVASTVVPQPSISSVAVDGANLIFSGSGGSAGAGYHVLASTNVALPLAQWTAVVTNHFDGGGNFSVKLPIAPGVPRNFFILQVP